MTLARFIPQAIRIRKTTISMISMQKKERAKLFMFLFVAAIQTMSAIILPSIGIPKTSVNPKYAHAPIGLNLGGSISSVI